MKQKIATLNIRPKLLLHVCCAPCSSACLSRLNAFEITLFYYNPNTYPQSEYDLRAEQFSKLTNLPFIKCNYNHSAFLDKIKGHEQDLEGGTRCQLCIANRLEQSFLYAKEHNYDYVTTTLTISPHKDAEYINEIGKDLENKYNVEFLPSDFKKENGFLNSIKLSKELNLYRQDYCGCEFSYRKNNQQ